MTATHRADLRISSRHDLLATRKLQLTVTKKPGPRFTKYLTTILPLSYDNAKVTIDLRRTSNLQYILRRAQGFS